VTPAFTVSSLPYTTPVHHSHIQEKLFFRMIYETTTRPGEVLESRIELWNRNTGEITFPIPKSKYNRWTRRHIPGAPRAMKLTSNTSEMLRHYMGNRKKRHIFINSRTAADPAAFREDDRQVGQAAEYPETSVHQAIRQGVSFDHVNGT
jgi:hypothetical protein